MSDFKRLTAFRTSVFNLVNANYVKVDNGADYVEVGERKISRARVIGTVVSKKVADDRSYAFITLDDGTETIGISSRKDFNTSETNVELFERVMVGDIVEVVGRINEWEGRRKLNCEIMKKIDDPNHWLYHKLELAKEEKVDIGGAEEAKQEEEHVVDDDLDGRILEIIKENDIGEGTTLSLIVNMVKKDEELIKEHLKKLLIDALIYEPRKFHYRVLE